MKFNKFIIVSMILLAVILIGAVNAAEDYNTTATDVVVDAGGIELDSPVIDEIDAGGDIGLDDSPSADEAVIDDTAIGTDEKQVEKLGAYSEDALGDDYEILDVEKFHEKGFDSGTIATGNYKMEGTFDANNDNFPSFIIFDSGCVVDASEAEFIDIGIILQGDVQLSGLTLTSSKYLEDVDNGMSPGAIVYVTGDDNILDGLTVNYAPTPDDEAYGIYVEEANNFQLLNSYVNFTGSSLEENYEYAMRVASCEDVLIQGNTIIANLPILNVDYNKGEPGLETDLVLNTGIREVVGLDIIDNTFIANVVDRNGDFPTLDCVMMEYCDNVNIIGNTFNETDFITNEGDANYLNVLDMYYSNNTLVQGNEISVVTTGGTDNAGTSYPIQLTGPYNGVVIDGNNLYANCGGPALGVYSQNYYGDTEITVQNNNINITGLPTTYSWGLVSGIELQDNVARVYNNTITTRAVPGTYEEGKHLYGISYAQALMDGHNYDIQGNTVVTEGQYTIYLLQADDTTITDNYLVSSTGEGDDTVYIREASGNTVIENNHGAKEEPETFYGVVTAETFFDFFKRSGALRDDIPEGATLDFQGEFISTSSTSYEMEINKPINMISTTKDVYIDLNAERFTVSENGSGTNISDIYFHNAQLWFFGAHNLNINNLTSIVEDKQIGSGVGVVAFRGGSSNIKVKNSYFSTKNNGGSSNFVLTNASYISVDNSTIIGIGNVGNLIYLNAYNLETMPEGWFLPQLLQAIAKGQITLNDHNNFTNCYIQGPETAAAICYMFTNMGNGFNIFENNTVVYSGAGIQSFGNDGIIKGNTFIGGCGINAAGARTQVIDNNLTTGTITAGGNNVITGNTVITTSNYAVELGKTKDNTVTDNYLVSNGKKADAAVNLGTGTGNVVQDNLPVDIILSIENPTISLGEGNSVTVTIAGAGEVTIKLNDVVIATPALTSGSVTQTISASDIIAGENTVEVIYRGITNSTTFYAEEATQSNIVTQDNFYDFFDDEGYLLDSVVFDELIFQGEFEDLVDYITIESPLTITGDGATLYNIGFIIQDADDVKLDNLTLIADENLGSLIKVTDSFNVNLTNFDITYDGGSEEAVAIEVVGDNVNILNSTIFFESHVPDDSVFAIALKLTECTNALVDGNKITAKLPCVYVYTYDDDYYMMGSDRVNPVRLKDCEGLVFTNNFINSTTNDYSADFPTIQSIQIIGCSNSILDHNNISMIDEMTPAGMDNYLYGINFGYNTNVTFSNNNFNMSTSGGKDAAGTAYAFQGVESEVLIKGNNITSISNGPNLGIYVASMYGGDSKLIIEDNIINVTGYASPSGNWALVSGIEIQNGDAQIYNNTIYTYNVNEYDDYSYMYGISYAQWMYGDRSFDIQNNTIYTEGKYTISVINATSLNVKGNTLYAHDLYGDDSINPGQCADVTLGDNLPPCLTNIVTQDNFYSFFDENGMLLDTIEFDELIFQGEFSNLVDTIIISDEITLTSDNAVLNNIALCIIGDDVSVTGFTLIENDANFTNNGGAAIYVSGSDVTLDNISVTYVAPSETEAIAVFANGADNFALINSEIIYTSTNPGDKHNYGLKVKDCDEAIIDNNTINAVLPAVPVSWGGEGISQDLVLAVGIQGGDDVEFTNNIVTVNTNGAVGSYPTIDAVMVHSANDILVKGNNITHVDTTTEDGARYYYSLDIYSTTGTVESNNIIVNTTAGVDRAGTAYPIQLTGPFTVTIKDNNLTAVSKGPIAGIYASNWGGPATLTVENNNIDVTGYATTGNYALVAGIEAEIDVLKAYNNTITVANGADYDDANQVIGVGIGSSYFYGDASADIKDNTITVDGQYAVYYANAVNTNVTDNTLYGHELEGDDAAVISNGTNNVIENNLPQHEYANISIEATGAWIGNNATINVNVPNATGTVTIEINGKSYSVDLVDGVATKEIPAEDLVAGENAITATYDGPEYASTTATGVLYVADGVVTQETYLYYFNQDDNGKLFDYIPDGATLDFQGSIINPDTNIVVQMNVNKPVNIVSTTEDAYVDLNTTAGSLLGESPGNSFAVTNGGSGSNVTGIYFHNTQVWIANTHNVVLDNISVVVEDQRVGSGVGATSIRENSTNVILKNSYLYTRNNGGSTTFTMSWATNCTIDNCTVKAEGNVGNLIYLNTFNINGAPSGVPLNNYNKVINNKIYGKEGSAISVGLMVEGQNNLIENNTLYKSSISTSFGGQNPYNNTYVGNTMTEGSGLTAQTGSIVYGNNVTGALSTGKESTVYNNIVGKSMTVGESAHVYNNTVATTMTVGKNSVVENNTIAGAVTVSGAGATFVGNNVTATVTVNSNDNVIKGNNITTTGDYAVDLKTKTGNNVTDNYLVASVYKGDRAVKSASETNIVENNTPKAEISVDANPVWIGSDASVVVSVPGAEGPVTVEVNGTSYTVNLTDGNGSVVIPAEDLAAGENIVTVTYAGPEFAADTAEGIVKVLDGVVTQETYLYYFNQDDNGRLFDYIPDGATLDFQGSIINPDQAITVQMNVNKPVNIVSTTKDAYVDLNTTAGSLLGESPGNSFAVTNGGSGSNVTGIYFHNTQIWIANTHNVVLDNISVVVEDQRVGSGVGATSIRENSTNVILKNSYLYTRNNGGSTTFTMSWATNCTIDNCTVKAEGNVGNLIYLNVYNIAGAPSGVPLNNNNTVSNNRIYGKEGSAISVGLMVEGQNNLIINNTLYKSSISTSFGGQNPYNNTYVGNTMTEGSGLTAQAGSIVYGNNVTGALSTGKESVAYDNVVGGKLTVGQDATAYNNTVGNGLTTGGTNAVIENNTINGAVTINKVGTTFVGNDVNGTVTVSANNNVIKGNNITTTGDYAVDLGSKTGNNVTDNYLIASELKGDAAVKYTNANNIVKDNRPIKDGSSVIIFPFSGAPYGEEIFLTYEVENETVVTVVVEDAEGNVITDGVDTSVAGEVTINGLVPGNYTITVINAESDLYKASNCSDTFSVVKATSAVYIDTISDVAYGEDVVVDYLVDNEADITVVVEDADGNVISDGVDTSVAEHVTISGLVPGEYTITIINAGNEYYTGSNATETFTVDKAESSVMIFPFSDVVSYGEEVFLGYEVENENVVTVVVVDAEGNVITDGVDTSVAGEVTITGLLPGNYTITITNDGNDNITGSSDSAEFTVTKKATFLMFNDDELTYADNPELIMTLMDENGNIIKNALIHVNNTLGVYKYRTDNVGAATVPVNLKPGEYEFAISYDGSDIYEGLNTTKTVVVNKMETVISVEDTTVTYKANDNYTITVTDANGNPVSGITVSVDNGAKVLRYRTGADGVANVPVTLKPGNYTFDVSFAGNNLYKASNSSSKVVVDKANVIIDAADLVVTYKDGSPFEATLTDVNGVAISGVTVKFDFMLNGVVKKSVRYHTDANGVASAPISIKPGDYECVVSFAGNSIYAAANVTKTLTINKAPANLEASNTEITYKDGNLTARLTDVDGNAISGATISFTQGTSTYRYHTDSNGVATAPINLKPGEYNYTISFAGNSMNGPVNTTAVVKVNKIDVVLTAQDIEMTFKDGTNYTAKLTDANGNPIAGVVVKVNRTGNTYKYKTDSEGMISVPLNFKVGTYDFVAFIEDSDIYNPTSVATTVTITK